MQFKQIIWDWNGTLWDDTWLCVEINNHMLERRGLPAIKISDYRAKLCFPVTDYYCQIGFDYNTDPYPRLAEEFIEEYTRRRFECPLHQEAHELLEDLQSAGIRQTVLSAYQHDTLIQAVDHFQLLDFFEDVIGLNDIYAHGKVENGKKYIAGLDINPAEVLFIGDTIHDFEVSAAMGVQCVLVANGHNSKDRLETCGVPVLESLAEVRGLIASDGQS